MPPQTPSIQINPYTSSVPTVQIPPEQIAPAQPLQGAFRGTGTGKLAIGDAVLKGFLAGHEYKAQRKAAQAQATLAAADAATQAAYQKYQDTLTKAGGDVNNPDAKAAYDAYTGVFNQSKEAKAKFVIPEEGAKKKTGQKSGVKDKAKGALGGIKDFFEANPHVVPQIALLTMQPEKPGLSQQSQAQLTAQKTDEAAATMEKAKADEAARKEQNEKTYQAGFAAYGHLTQPEIDALPASERAKYGAWEAARASLNQTSPTRGASKLYQMADGSKEYYVPGTEPPGSTPVLSAAQSGSYKPGSKEEYFRQFAAANNTTPDRLPFEVTEALQRRWQADQARTTTSSTTTTPGIDSTSSAATHGVVMPPLPGGWTDPVFGNAAPSVQPAAVTRTRGMTPAPPAPKPRGMTAAPGAAQPGTSLHRSQMTQHVNDQKLAKVEAARKELSEARIRNLRIADPEARKQADKEAQDAFDDEMKATNDWYDQQVRAIGGTPGSDSQKKGAQSQKASKPTPPKGATMEYVDKDGNVKGYAVNGVFVAATQ